VSVEPLLANPVFPRFGIAADNGLMREVFQQHLPPLDMIYHIRDCRLSQINFRRVPAASCSTLCASRRSPRGSLSTTPVTSSRWPSAASSARSQTGQKRSQPCQRKPVAPWQAESGTNGEGETIYDGTKSGEFKKNHARSDGELRS